MAYKFYPAKKYKWVTIPISFFKDMLIARRNNEKDNVVLVTGARGDGKSTFTGKVFFSFDDFDPYEAMVYNKDAMFTQIKKRMGYVWADEAVVNAAKGNVMSRANKMLHEVVTINRDNFNIVFFCMPFVEDFDSKILEYVSAWVHIDSRGLAVVLLPANKGLFGKKNWDIDGMKKIYDEFVKENQNQSHIPYWIYPNFRGYIRFGKLSDKQKQIIDEIKSKRKNENLEKQNQENVVVEVKKFEEYNKYSAKKIAEMIAKGEIRSKKEFEDTCQSMKLEPEEMYNKCDNLFRKSNLGKTTKGWLKEYEKADNLIKF